MEEVTQKNKIVKTTIHLAINDKFDGNSVPSMPMGETEDGKTLWAKAVMANQESADEMVAFLNKQAGQDRFEAVPVELWRPTDIEIYVRQRIREHGKDSGPKIILS